MNRPLNVLIACECSGAVCREFRALGHSAFSCDLKPRTDGNTKHHIQGDMVEAMRRGRPTDGAKWDLVISHRTCRYLANSGALRLYKGGKKENGMDMDRYALMRDGALDFRRQFFIGEYQGPLCAENPVMHKWAREIIDLDDIPRQTIQPYHFGDDASKATQLWLRGLPPLVIDRAQYIKPRMVCQKCRWTDVYDRAFEYGCPEHGTDCLLPRWANQTPGGQNKLGPSAERAAIRAVTYPGIAKAMAVQWGAHLNSLLFEFHSFA